MMFSAVFARRSFVPVTVNCVNSKQTAATIIADRDSQEAEEIR